MKKLLTILLPMLLASCTNMNAKFDCPMKNGVRCESLDKVNARVDNGEMGRDETAQRIWIAPFKDAAGHYHGENYIYLEQAK
jgi:hypothetical protein